MSRLQWRRSLLPLFMSSLIPTRAHIIMAIVASSAGAHVILPPAIRVPTAELAHRSDRCVSELPLAATVFGGDSLVSLKYLDIGAHDSVVPGPPIRSSRRCPGPTSLYGVVRSHV